MSLDHGSTSSSLALRHCLNDLESTLWRNIKKHEASFRTAHTDSDEEDEDTSAWARLLKREGGEDGKDAVPQKTEQTETPKMAKGKP